MHSILSILAVLAFLYLARPGGPLRPESELEPAPVRSDAKERSRAAPRRGPGA